jgi:hypothetical protein
MGSGGMIWARRYLIAAGAAAVLGALLSLCLPIHLDAADRNGQFLSCGTALNPDGVGVGAEDRLNALRHSRDRDRLHLSDYTGECAAWIIVKREVALGVASTSVGVIIAAAFLMHPSRRRQLTSTVAKWTSRMQGRDVHPRRSRPGRNGRASLSRSVHRRRPAGGFRRWQSWSSSKGRPRVRQSRSHRAAT